MSLFLLIVPFWSVVDEKTNNVEDAIFAEELLL